MCGGRRRGAPGKPGRSGWRQCGSRRLPDVAPPGPALAIHHQGGACAVAKCAPGILLDSTCLSVVYLDIRLRSYYRSGPTQMRSSPCITATALLSYVATGRRSPRRGRAEGGGAPRPAASRGYRAAWCNPADDPGGGRGRCELGQEGQPASRGAATDAPTPPFCATITCRQSGRCASHHPPATPV